MTGRPYFIDAPQIEARLTAFLSQLDLALTQVHCFDLRRVDEYPLALATLLTIKRYRTAKSINHVRKFYSVEFRR